MQLMHGIDALLVSTHANIRYLTGFHGASDSEREAFVLVTRKFTHIFSSALYQEEILKLTGSHLAFSTISLDYPLSKRLKTIIRAESIVTVGFEDDDLRFKEYEELKHKLSIPLIPTHNRVTSLRQIKTPEELKYIKQAARLTDECFSTIKNYIIPGVRENHIVWEIEKFIKSRGAELAFAPIVSFGTNSSKPHYINDRNAVLQKRDVALLDFGAKVSGYCSDMTRVLFIGSPQLKMEKTYHGVLDAQEQSLKLLSAGERNGAVLDKSARQTLKRHNLPEYPHSLGHSLGLEIHESPRLTYKKDTILKPGTVVTVEPAVYFPGEFGIRIEDLVVVKENTIEILSQSPKKMA